MTGEGDGAGQSAEDHYQSQLARVRDILEAGQKLRFRDIRGLGIGQKAAQRIRQELVNTGEIVQKGNTYIAAGAES